MKTCVNCKEEWPCRASTSDNPARVLHREGEDDEEEMDPMASMRRGHQAGKPPSVASWSPPSQPATPSRYFSNVTEEDRQRVMARLRAKRGLSGPVPRPWTPTTTTTRPQQTTKPKPPKRAEAPLTTAQALTDAMKKSTTNKTKK